MENNFIWTDDKVMEFAIKFLKDRVNWAVMHDFAAAPEPIQVALKSYKASKVNWEVVQYGYAQNNVNETEQQYIQSVKRLSDGEVFQRGDAVTYAHEMIKSEKTVWHIDRFTLHGNQVYVMEHWAGDPKATIETWIKLRIL